MDLLCLLCRSGLARTDGPNRFVSDHEVLVLLLGEVVNHLFDLGLHHVEVFAGLALVEVLADAVDGDQPVCIGLRHLLLLSVSGGLAVVLAAPEWPRITYLHPSAAIIEAAISPGRAPLASVAQSLRAECDVRTLQGLGNHRQMGERRADDEVHARANLSPRPATTPLASSTPSAGSVFIFQLPATIFFLIVVIFFMLISLSFV